MHTLLDYDGKRPVYLNITEGSVGDNKNTYDIALEKVAVIVANRYHNDFPLLNSMVETATLCFFFGTKTTWHYLPLKSGNCLKTKPNIYL